MLKNIYITLSVLFLFAHIGQAQIEIDRVEEDYTAQPSSIPITLEAARSVTILPTSHLTLGSNVLITIDETVYLPSMLTTDNYIFTRSYRTPLTNPSQIASSGDVIENISYFDGLGRQKQDIALRFTPGRQDLVTHIGYDNVGRAFKNYLPYKADGELGLYRSDAESQVNNFYLSHYGEDLDTGNPNPFSETAYEDAVLNRPLKQAAPGHDWRMGGGNEIEFDYKLNTTADAVRKFEVSFVNNNPQNPQLGESGTYAANALTRTVTRDENHSGGVNNKNHTVEEFLDKRGRTILKRTYAAVGINNQAEHDTYYVYDDHDNLTYVIPPEASSNTTITTSILNGLCYQYKFDEKNRMIEKKLPGKGGPNNLWESIVYNKNDQPILTQDPNLKASNTWLFTKYDAFGRIAYTGKMVRNVDRATLQNEANLASETYVNPKNGTSIAGTTVEYNNAAFPTTNITDIHTVNFYDNNSFNKAGLSLPSSVYGQSVTSNTNDLPIGSRVRVLGTTNNVYLWITTLFGYDAKGRVIYEAKKNAYLGTTDIMETKLDFSGRTLEVKTTHQKAGKADVVTIDEFDYDHMDRLLTQTQTLAGNTEVLVQNVYDALGQQQQKKLGNTLSNPLQTIDYDYNIRGWLQQLNNVDNLGGDLFAFKINYNITELSSIGATPLFNGNISETLWRSKNDDIKRGYGYSYDALNRIKTAGFTDNMNTGTGEFNTEYSYDKNGNINSLNRNGWQNSTDFMGMDNLIYSYSNHSNQLSKVKDNGNTAYGFKDLADTGIEYEYDANGNMVADANKGIPADGIEYNYLNLPTYVSIQTVANYGTVRYVYGADGSKVKKIVNDQNGQSETDYAGNFIYENGNLKQFSHSEGYIEVNGTGDYDYAFSYFDHLGTIRLTYSDFDGNGSIEPATEILQERNTYPFGLKHKGYNSNINGKENNYQTYLGQEINKELGLDWLTFRYRNYAPEIGRFFGIDPISEDFLSISMYQFAHNNPVWKIELEGLEGEISPKIPDAVDIPNEEPVAGNTDLGTSLIAIDPNFNHITSELRTGLFNDADFGGFINPATDVQYDIDPLGAIVADITFAGLSFFGFDAVDNAGATVADPDVAVSTKVTAVLSTLPALTRGGGKTPKPKSTAKPKSVHGNDKNSTKTQHGYRIKDEKTGETLEFGISGQKLTKNRTVSPRILQKLRKKYKNNPNAKGEILKDNIPNRKKGLKWEVDKVNKFFKKHKRAPVNQIRPKPKG